MVGGGMQEIPEGFEAAKYIKRAYANSECRVAIITASEDGDPLLSVAKLAKDSGSALWTIEMKDEKSEQNAIDYIEVGLNNGDWVFLTQMEMASQDVLRKIALALSLLKPDPKHFPRRENFRLWLVFDKHISLDDNVLPPVPQLLAQHSIVAHNDTSPKLPNKWVKRTPQEPTLFEYEMAKHQSRREAGKQSDSESDTDEPGQKIVGKWFSRAVEFHHADSGSTLTRANDEVFRFISLDDDANLSKVCKSGQVNLLRLKHPVNDMTPLQFAVSNEKIMATKVLLDFGCDPNEARAADRCPPLFMSIESEELVRLLVERGASIDTKFEGYTLERHPNTAPNVSVLIKQLKGLA